jgi:catechol 2,3-dioxygenase-like lactoylglutathione lyase family enzyme
MPPARVSAVRSVDIGVTDLETARLFYTAVWNLDPVADAEGVIYLRATGPYHHVLSLRRAPRAGLIRIVLGADDRAATDALYEQVSSVGQTTSGPPKPLARPGGGYGFGFKDPEGRNFAVVSEVADHADAENCADRPRKISHVNLNCAINDATFKFMAQALGFRLSDHANNFRFIRCNSDHHSLVIGFNDDATLNHVAFEMPDLDSVMRGIGRMRDHGYPIEWGPGRHGPGDNVFAYFCGPEEFPLEYTAEMLKVDDSYRVGSPEDWKWPPGRVDQWGIMAGPSARVKRAQRLFRFSEDGYRLEG